VNVQYVTVDFLGDVSVLELGFSLITQRLYFTYYLSLSLLHEIIIQKGVVGVTNGAVLWRGFAEKVQKSSVALCLTKL